MKALPNLLQRPFNYLRMHFKSRITRYSFFISGLFYCAYSSIDNNWANPYLFAPAALLFLLMPFFARISNKFEQMGHLYTGKMVVGRVVRFMPQIMINYSIIYSITRGGIIPQSHVDAFGGFMGITLYVTMASQGLQYIGIAMANRGYGERFTNVTLAVSTNIIVTALAVYGLIWFRYLYLAMGFSAVSVGILYFCYTDLKAMFAPKGGIGVYFGTFNPMHSTHVRIAMEMLEKRKLDKVLIHPVAVPLQFRLWLEKGDWRVGRFVDGMRIYELTEKADLHINYFLVGNSFYEIENRLAMMEAAIKDMNLQDKLEVIYYPEEYYRDGFYAVLKRIKRQYKGARIHGLHGSDAGGMLARYIYDESFGVWPYSVVRRDKVSGTSIREGSRGMTTESVQKMVDFLRGAENKTGERITVHGTEYEVANQMLLPVTPSPQAAHGVEGGQVTSTALPGSDGACNYIKTINGYKLTCISGGEFNPEVSEFVADVYYNRPNYDFSQSLAAVKFEMMKADELLGKYSTTYTLFDADDQILGTMRKIKLNTKAALPIEDAFDVDFKQLYQEYPNGADCYELSRLAIRDEADPDIFQILKQHLFGDCNDDDLLLAAIDDSVYNSIKKVGTPYRSIGEPKFYLGSLTHPLAVRAWDVKQTI